MRSLVFAVFALTACSSGAVRINDGDTDVYDANDHKDNQPPGPPEVNLTPSGADTRDDLKAEILFPAEDPDGDHVTYEYVWLVDGDVRHDLTESTVSKDETEKGQRWEVRVRAFDGRAYSTSASDDVDIGNAPPTLQLRWKNDSPSTDDDLVVRTNKDDPDGDIVTLAFTWTVDGATTPYITDTIPAAATTGGQVWAVTVVATDEDDATHDESLDVTILNRAPDIANLAITPNPAPPSAALLLSGNISDADGDTVVTSYAWTVNGTATAFTATTIPASATEDGQTWVATVTADDQHGGVTTATASAQVINHPPTLTQVSIDPLSPGNDNTLWESDDAADADGDPLTYTYVWYRNGTVFAGAVDFYVDSSFTSLGETWQVSVTVSDGTTVVGPVSSAPVTIVNHPPSSAVLALDPSAPNTCSSLQCVIATDSVDPDGTTVTQVLSWKRNGVAYSGARAQTDFPDDTIPVDAMVGGDVWTCRVTSSSDGQSSVPAELSATVLGSTAVETFTASARTQADILLMVDNSCSMGPAHTNFVPTMNTLISTLDAASVNYHIGVVTSDMDDVTQSGRMVVGTLGSVYVTPSVPTREAVLDGMVNVGEAGSGVEKPVLATQAALTAPLVTTDNAGFLRSSGALGILFLTDEDDQSITPSATAYTTWLRSLRTASDLTLWGIIGDPTGTPGSLGYTCENPTTLYSAVGGFVYDQILRDLHGVWTSICDVSFDNSVRDFADAVAGLPRRFPLTQKADAATLSVVKIAAGTGARTTLAVGTNYVYDSVTNAVLLTATPTNGTSFEVHYNVTCATTPTPTPVDTGSP